MEKERIYKHNNEELLSGESERILHKNAKNFRCRQYEIKRKEKRNKILGYVFITFVFLLFISLFYVGGLMTRY